MEFDEVVEIVIRAAKENNISIGISVNTLDDLKRWWERGMDFFLVSHDMGLLHSAMSNYDRDFSRPQVGSRS